MKLAYEASNYGIQAVIICVMDNGQDKTIIFASCTWVKCEINNAQIEIDIAIALGFKMLQHLLLGRLQF